MKHVIVFFVLILISSFGAAMSLFDAGKSCVFSEVKLKVTHNGKPASGARLTRYISWQKEVSDEFTLDDNGEIHLEAVYQRSLTSLLPVEFVVAQSLTVSHQGKEVEIWLNSKRRPDENSELGGQALALTCELSNEPVLHEEFKTLLLTNCNW